MSQSLNIVKGIKICGANFNWLQAIKYVHIIGATTIGTSIAKFFLAQQIQVTLHDTDSYKLNLIKKSLDDESNLLIIDLSGLGAQIADLVIECTGENFITKQKLWENLEPVVKKNALLCTYCTNFKPWQIAGKMTDADRLKKITIYNNKISVTGENNVTN